MGLIQIVLCKYGSVPIFWIFPSGPRVDPCISGKESNDRFAKKGDYGCIFIEIEDLNGKFFFDGSIPFIRYTNFD